VLRRGGRRRPHHHRLGLANNQPPVTHALATSPTATPPLATSSTALSTLNPRFLSHTASYDVAIMRLSSLTAHLSPLLSLAIGPRYVVCDAVASYLPADDEDHDSDSNDEQDRAPKEMFIPISHITAVPDPTDAAGVAAGSCTRSLFNSA